MKILLDTDVLLTFAENPDSDAAGAQLIRLLLEKPELSLWASALSLYLVEKAVSQTKNNADGEKALGRLLKMVAVIPLRSTAFTAAAGAGGSDLEPSLLAAGARELQMAAIISNAASQYNGDGVAVFTPEQFLDKLQSGRSEPVDQVPFLDLKAQHALVYNQIDACMTDIIAHTGFILGKYVSEFEKGFARLQESRYCLGVSSGTDALHIALMALGVQQGDRVLVPVNTFIATAEAVSLCGAVPVFVDCDDFFNMDVAGAREIIRREEGEKIRRAEEQKGRRAEEQKGRRAEEQRGGRAEGRIVGIIPVHLYGQPADMDAVMALAEKYHLWVVEDCCQAHLAELKDRKVGSFGAFGAFSFYPGKNLGAYGEAGALVGNHKELFETANMLRQHGEIARYHHRLVGHNYRMEAFQGAVLSAKLTYIEQWTQQRRENAALYSELLADVAAIETPRELGGTLCVHHLYVIQAERRDELQAYLANNNISTGLHYPIPLHLQEAYSHLGYHKGDFPKAERAAGRILSLPMYPELTERQIRYVCDTIRGFYEGR